MPPVTPSPHRFRQHQSNWQESSSDTAKQPFRTPAPVKKDPVHLHSRPPYAPATQPSVQFAQTPRFSTSHRRQRDARSPPPSVVNALRPSLPKAETVEEAHDADDDYDDQNDDETTAGEMLMSELEASHRQGNQDMNNPMQNPIDYPDWTQSLPFSPKRRKLENSQLDDHTSPFPTWTTTPFIEPSQTAEQLSRSIPNFKPPSRPDQQILRKPAFLPSSTAALDLPPSHPLPEAFSPHRRGRRFVPGGMAATLQQWVVETGQTAMQSRHHITNRPSSRNSAENEHSLRFRIVDIPRYVRHASTCLVQGVQNDDLTRKFLLISSGGHGDRVENEINFDVGASILVNAPVWTVDLLGDSCVVCVDWKLLL